MRCKNIKQPISLSPPPTQPSCRDSGNDFFVSQISEGSGTFPFLLILFLFFVAKRFQKLNWFRPMPNQSIPTPNFRESYSGIKVLWRVWKIGVGCKTVFEINAWFQFLNMFEAFLLCSNDSVFNLMNFVILFWSRSLIFLHIKVTQQIKFCLLNLLFLLLFKHFLDRTSPKPRNTCSYSSGLVMLKAEQTNIEVAICGKCNQMQFYFCLAFHLLTCNHHSGHGHLYYFLKCFFLFCISSFWQGSLHRLYGLCDHFMHFQDHKLAYLSVSLWSLTGWHTQSYHTLNLAFKLFRGDLSWLSMMPYSLVVKSLHDC